MTPQVLKTPRAKEDLLHHYEYIGERNPLAADRFLKAAEAAFSLLAKLPKMGRAWESDSPRLEGCDPGTSPNFAITASSIVR